MKLSSMIGMILLCITGLTSADESKIPSPFQGHTNGSQLTVEYKDLDAFLKLHVLDLGPSTRQKAPKAETAIGTKMRGRVNRYTALEGNRVFFKNLQNPEIKSILNDLVRSLESLPEEVPLKLLARSEQLAYWLNLYNFALLNELAEVYPKSSLKRVLDYGDEDSILAQKILEVAGVPLSLDDIQFTILKNKFPQDVVIIYGLFQGNIGGPNLTRYAYRGSNVWKMLEENADNFINANRGTNIDGRTSVKVSEYFERNMAYFDNDKEKLRAHLIEFLHGDMEQAFTTAKRIYFDIADWSMADLFGNRRTFGGAYQTNHAALLDAVMTTQPGDAFQAVQIQSYLSSDLQTKAKLPARFSEPEIELLLRLRDGPDINSGKVKVTDIEQ